MTNYELLRQRLNELLPKTVDIVCCPWCGNELKKFKDVRYDRRGFALNTCNECGACSHLYFADLEEYDEKKRAVSITDILRGILRAKKYPGEWFINATGLLINKNVEAENTVADICLTKPLSHPDNDAAMGAIYQLLK